MFFHDPPTTSEVLEECFHFLQELRGDYSDLEDDELELRREIDAKRYLLSVTEQYRIPRSEIESTQRKLQEYEQDLGAYLDAGKDKDM